ncbi:hypothetical protein COT49_02140 [candidate division WWE3 bacterium CG08_land_8_20_14_0_20_40_13]|uniref:Type 4 fimbrial biogenesis protein PilX N-terminal domain-containing protein n=1 Tax=candidate division WWE3 bacterium CG08_land_8_20_14_0_20_40_13 TaxID=1975084 RepID=A0A2H0XFZ1_UNCKA|nr:MAG: hypothetical protein COT49_02140 [candidate division WWE3 bacterium CG08_land_8_20_14_0_20_40_13]
MRKRSGQATLVLVVTVMVVSLAVGVASARRAVSGIRRSTYSQQADQAYSCAEAGAEQGISETTNNGSSSIGGPYGPTNLDSEGGNSICSYTYTISDAKENENGGCTYSMDTEVQKDDVFEVNLKGYNGNFAIYWGSSNDASLEVTLIKGSSPPYDVEKSAFYCDTAPSPSGGFEAGNQNSPLSGYHCYTNSFNIGGNYQIARIRPLFESANIKAFFNDCGSVPVQGFKIISEGLAGEAKRRLQVKVTNPQLSSIFDFVMFSGGDISK